MKRTVKDPEVRKKELVDAAEHLFITEGYEQTAISDIVKAVNVSQGTFYYYFESKEDALVAVLAKRMATLENEIGQIATESGLDEAVKLNAMINRFISVTASGRDMLNYIHQHKSATLHSKLMKIKPFAGMAPIIAEVITNGVEKGRFATTYPLETAYLMLIMLASAMHMFFRPEAFDESGSKKPDRPNEAGFTENRERMRTALEDNLGRMLGVSDYRFFLQI